MEKNLIIDIKILKYDSSHNHPEKEYDVSLSIMKHKIKDGIEKKFNSMEYNDDIFVDGTFFIAPKFSYQIFITRTYAKELDTNEISVLIERYKNIETKLIDTKCDRNNTINLWFDSEGENLSDFSVVSVTDSNSLSLSEKWIAHHIELIQKAKNRRMIYRVIENIWDDKNVFGATILDDGTIIPCRSFLRLNVLIMGLLKNLQPQFFFFNVVISLVQNVSKTSLDVVPRIILIDAVNSFRMITSIRIELATSEHIHMGHDTDNSGCGMLYHKTETFLTNMQLPSYTGLTSKESSELEKHSGKKRTIKILVNMYVYSVVNVEHSVISVYTKAYLSVRIVVTTLIFRRLEGD
ncbi:hypothetical protein H8356DRAFT_1425042 [Neocallimastix lanati (nom. inval.)]|nr:hypothetical protein H8356DRAFT_1425042 [Neocallimastix sp. JGI-2020a]